MPFEGAGPYWPWSDAGEGANNDRIWSSLPGTNTTNGGCRFTGATTAYILHKPGVANNTTPNQTAQPAAIAAQGFGYNILKADINANANLPAQRLIPSGNWTFKVVINTTAVDVDAVFGFYVNIYKRSATGVLTHLAGGESNLASVAAGDNDRTATVAVPEVTLQTDETIHVEYWMRGNGPAVGNNDLLFVIGDPTLGDATNIALPGAGLRYKYPRSQTVAAAGNVAAPTRTIKRSTTVAAGGTAILGARAVRKAFTVAATSAVDFSRRLTLKIVLSVAASPAAVLAKRVTRRFLDVAAVGNAAATFRLTLKRVFVVSGVSDAVFARRLTAFQSYSVAGSAGSSFSRALTSKRFFEVLGTGDVSFTRRLFLFLVFQASGTAAVDIKRLVRRQLSVAGAGGSDFTRALRIARAFSVAGVPTVEVDTVAMFKRLFSVAGTANVDFTRRLALMRNFGVTGTPGSSSSLKSIKQLTVAASPGVAFARLLNARREFAVLAEAASSFSRVSRARRSFVGAGTPATVMWVMLREDVLDRMTAGGTTVVRKFIAIFDD